MSERNAASGAINAVTLELIWTRLISAVDEAAKAVVRTSFSTLSNEANDFACVLTDAVGRSLTQNTGSIPSFIGTLPATVRAMRVHFPVAEMRPGDVYVTNNPWIGTGHLNDICVVRPIFAGPEIVAFAAATSHVPDIGGRQRSTEARELFEEGFHIPPMRLLREGEPDRSLIQLLRTNVRTPDQTEGDVWALVNALALIEERVRATMADHGLADLAQVAEEIFSRSDQAMRRQIAALPDGVYSHTMLTDGLAEPFTLAVRITIKGDEILADYAGTSPQQPRAVNCVLAYTFAMTVYALKCLLLPQLANNDGIFRAIRAVAPEGSLLNPRHPAAVGGRAATGHYVPVLVFNALADILPDKVRSAPGSPLWIMNMAGTTASGRTFASVMFFNGGTGAGEGHTGVDCLSWPSNISATPIEVVERTAPVLIHRKVLRDTSGGSGRHRGGRGQEVVIETEAEDVAAVFVAERLRFGASGLHGGGEGARGEILIDGVAIDGRTLQSLKRGTIVTVRTPGGGGFGAA
ncbi:hydantoinase B/oxoprolinase family protein [Roseixanthobacter glucoisosaccharinicivorans]|uniref:hydantoinase B/oxoprolinase family protein n=1 Tax=Roseixanthobacter glucoisosaccharinicivorans TaxID=3119923 RepID=UPI00372A7604